MLRIAHTVSSLGMNFLEVDDAYCDMLQLEPAKLYRRTFLDITHPSCRHANRQQIEALIDFGKPFWIRKNYVRDDGSLVDVLNHVTSAVGITGIKRIVATTFILPEEGLIRPASLAGLLTPQMLQ